jgi:hypothetical protein
MPQGTVATVYDEDGNDVTPLPLTAAGAIVKKPAGKTNDVNASFLKVFHCFWESNFLLFHEFMSKTFVLTGLLTMLEHCDRRIDES